LPIARLPGLEPEADKVSSRHTVAGRLHPIILVLGAGEQFLVIVGRIKKPAVVGVKIISNHVVGQALSELEPALIRARLVQTKQAVDEKRIIVQISVDFWGRRLPGGGSVSSQQDRKSVV